MIEIHKWERLTYNNDVSDCICDFVGFYNLCSCYDVCLVLENFCLS